MSKVKCFVCEKEFTKLTPRHIITHNMTVDQYKSLYPDSIFQDNTMKYIEIFRNIHGDKYLYDTENIISNPHTKIKILCPDHGEFYQRPDMHKQGQGCPSCSHNKQLTIDDFIYRSTQKHGNKYEYDRNSFVGVKHNTNIICRTHGIFSQRAEVHLRGGGCPSCAKEVRNRKLKIGNVSKAETKWLDELKVITRQHTLRIKTKSFNVDGFDPITNTIYEFYGDYWHGNPKKFPHNDIHPQIQVSYGTLYENTMRREKIFRKAGYNVVSKWETD